MVLIMKIAMVVIAGVGAGYIVFGLQFFSPDIEGGRPATREEIVRAATLATAVGIFVSIVAAMAILLNTGGG